MEFKTIRKGEILQRPGSLNTKVYIVKSGMLRSYIIDDKGKEHIFMFAPENWIIGDHCPPDRASTLYIDAVEESVISIREKDPSKETDVPKFLRRLEVLQERILMLLSSPAIDRYEHFINTYPEIIQRVPQKMVASYLGITPEALSKVKNSYLKK